MGGTVAEPDMIRGYCTECNRPIRKRQFTAEQAPGTMALGANGLCLTDYNRRRSYPPTDEQRARRREIVRDKFLGTYVSKAQLRAAEDEMFPPEQEKIVGFQLSGDDRTVAESVIRRKFDREVSVDLMKCLGILPRDAV